MRIFVSAIGYNCAEHLDDVLSAFMATKKMSKEILVGLEVTISVAHGVFPEIAQLGFPTHSTDGTENKLREYFEKGYDTRKHLTHMADSDVLIKLDKLVIADKPIFEKDLRNLTLEGFNLQDYDLLWLLDLQDEIYTLDNIMEALNCINRSKFTDWFKINFKNYVIDNETWIDGFCPPRIWRTKPHGGIKGFYYDNEIEYNDGSRAPNHPSAPIPRGKVFVKHLSWVGSPEYLQRKIQFQKLHYGHCSYRWNETEGKLEFDPEYYKKTGEGQPVLNKH